MRQSTDRRNRYSNPIGARYSLVIFRVNGKTVDSFELVSHRAEIGAVHLSRRAATMQGDVIELDNNLEARWREGMK